MDEGFDDQDEEPTHPILNEKRIREILGYLQQEEEKLIHGYKIQSEASPENPYFRFNEGLELRPEVAIAFVLKYLRENES